MARADLLLDLIKNSATGNRYQFKKIVEAIIAEEREKQHLQLADKIQQELDAMVKASEKEAQDGYLTSSAVMPIVNNFLHEASVKKTFDDLVLPNEVKRITMAIVEEQSRADLLRSYSLEPRHKILLVGEPGTGKTSYAEALAERLMIPLYLVRYDALIGSYLGETSMRLRQLFDFVSSRKCVLFFDEFDTIGKERGDTQELGEIKRVVSSFLMMTDNLPSYTVVIGASNHPELLDRAVWRRFQVRMAFPMPNKKAIEIWLDLFRKRYNIPLGKYPGITEQLAGKNFGDIENFALSVMRRYVLSEPGSNFNKIVKDELLATKKNITTIKKK